MNQHLVRSGKRTREFKHTRTLKLNHRGSHDNKSKIVS